VNELLVACVGSLAGYRRELNEHQPCDAERAAVEHLRRGESLTRCNCSAAVYDHKSCTPHRCISVHRELYDWIERYEPIEDEL
jgi:hypothetical protein